MKEYYENLRQRVEAYLPTALREIFTDPDLHEAAQYSVMAGGKRLRPVLVLHAARVRPEALPAAAALEFIHTSSLIHDDLPAMDDDSLRRGKPTLHRAKGEAMAILGGDALGVGSFRLLARYQPPVVGALVSQLSAAYIQMVMGQVWDSIPERSLPPTEESLFRIYDHKTGALLTASLVAGAIVGGNDEMLEWVQDFGRVFGRLFQATDDLLDVEGNEGELGKTTGTDERQGRLTAVTLLGVDSARVLVEHLQDEALSIVGDRDRFLRWLVQYTVTRSK